MNKQEFLLYLESLLHSNYDNYVKARFNESTEDKFFWRGSISQLEILRKQIERGDFDK